MPGYGASSDPAPNEIYSSLMSYGADKPRNNVGICCSSPKFCAINSANVQTGMSTRQLTRSPSLELDFFIVSLCQTMKKTTSFKKRNVSGKLERELGNMFDT